MNQIFVRISHYLMKAKKPISQVNLQYSNNLLVEQLAKKNSLKTMPSNHDQTNERTAAAPNSAFMIAPFFSEKPLLNASVYS